MTRPLWEQTSNDKAKHEEVMEALKKYINCDWGVLGEDDKRMNDEAILNNDDRILARYSLSFGDIYIITEADRSYTTIMFCEDY